MFPYQWGEAMIYLQLQYNSSNSSDKETVIFLMLAEQLTLNQRVQGSSPCAPTIDPKRFFLV